MAAATDITTEARGLMPYQPIENHGIIGNMRTAALVGLNGSIDWLCFPRFDSPSVFAAILDDKKGGYFKIAPIGDEIVHKQLYWPCLLYTSDAADERSSVDLGGRRII